MRESTGKHSTVLAAPLHQPTVHQPTVAAGGSRTRCPHLILIVAVSHRSCITPYRAVSLRIVNYSQLESLSRCRLAREPRGGETRALSSRVPALLLVLRRVHDHGDRTPSGLLGRMVCSAWVRSLPSRIRSPSLCPQPGCPYRRIALASPVIIIIIAVVYPSLPHVQVSEQYLHRLHNLHI